MGECDAACQKIIIDTGMGVFAANLYGRTLARIGGFTPADYEAPEFYVNVAEKFGEIASSLHARKTKKLSKDDLEALMLQIDKQCYRADDLIVWARNPAPTQEHVNTWTNNLFLWAKEDQEFYTELIKEVG